MRLTNVAMMTLPQGRLRSYAVRPGSVGAELPISFDQRRHVGAGHRPGSWMAISFRLPTGTSAEELESAWLRVVARHGTLRTVFSRSAEESGVEPGRLHLHQIEVLPGQWHDHEVGERRSRDVVRSIFDTGCTPFQTPSHRVCLLEPEDPDETGDQRPIALIGADHAHVDMWSVLVLARDLLAGLGAGSPATPEAAGSEAVPSFAEHTAYLEAAPTPPEQVRSRWAQILAASGGTMPTFPLPLGRLDPAPAEVVEVHDVLDAPGWERFEQAAESRGHRPASLAVSALTQATAELAGKPLRAVFPVHSRHQQRWHESVGWFITNAVLESAEVDLGACRTALREAVQLGSSPLAPILAPYGGMPEGPGMFAVSWLDVRRLPISLDPTARAQYVSAAMRTDGVMVWFVVTGTGMHLRCRYPDTDQARASVTSWLRLVIDLVRCHADETDHLPSEPPRRSPRRPRS